MPSDELCSCGRVHELPARSRRTYDMLREVVGPTRHVTIPAGTWEVPMIWIWVHGLKSRDLPGLALRYGWERVQ